MKTSTKIIAAAAAALALGAGGLVFAQAGQGPYGRMGGGMGIQHAGMGMGMNGGGHAGMRGAGPMADPAAWLATTKTELKITAAQESAWQAYEGVVREQASARQAMRTAMQDPNAAAATDHAAQQASMLKLRESHLAALDAARQALYAALAPEQKALAEQRLGAGPGQRQGPGARMHRHTS